MKQTIIDYFKTKMTLEENTINKIYEYLLYNNIIDIEDIEDIDNTSNIKLVNNRLIFKNINIPSDFTKTFNFYPIEVYSKNITFDEHQINLCLGIDWFGIDYCGSDYCYYITINNDDLS